MNNHNPNRSIGIDRKRLAAYSSQAVLLLLGTQLEAQTVYTDINPDFGVFDHYQNDDLLYPIDFNGDGIIDISISFSRYYDGNWFSTYYTFKLKPRNFYAVAASSAWLNPAIELNNGDTINAALPWHIADNVLIGEIQAGEDYSYWYTDNWWFHLFGNFADADSKYLGVKFLIDGEMHYGWVRLSIKNHYTSLDYSNNINFLQAYVQGYAYNPVANAPVVIQDEHNLGIATEVKLTDIYDTGNTSDILISFNVPEDESGIGQYRVVFAPFIINQTLDIDTVITAVDYLEILPTGENVSTFLPNGQKDMFGNPIILGHSYVAYVLSVGNAASGYHVGLSTPSFMDNFNNSDHCLFTADLVATMVGDDGNASDCQITFSGAIFEDAITEYRVFLVSMWRFDYEYPFLLYYLEDIDDPTLFQTVVPDGSGAYSITLDPALTDCDGDPVTPDTYAVMVLGKHDPAMQDGDCSSNYKYVTFNAPTPILQTEIQNAPHFFVDGEQLICDVSMLAHEQLNALFIDDILGQRCLNTQFSNENTRIDIGALPDGIYFATLQSGTELYTYKFIKK